MRRRKFIVLATATAAALGVSYWYLDRHFPDGDFVIATPESLTSIWDPETISGIGSLYRERWPEENNAASLKKIIREKTGEGQDVVRAILLAVQEDFRTGETVIIDGWILARTEARQCALYSLIKT
ncbi:MAG: hypothetical protein WBN18_04230 [Flavobacteriaceae bacterium]